MHDGGGVQRLAVAALPDTVEHCRVFADRAEELMLRTRFAVGRTVALKDEFAGHQRGSVGSVVHVYDGAGCYEVEFVTPPCVLTVDDNLLTDHMETKYTATRMDIVNDIHEEIQRLKVKYAFRREAQLALDEIDSIAVWWANAPAVNLDRP